MKEMTVRRSWRSCKCSGDNFGKYKNTKISEYKIQEICIKTDYYPPPLLPLRREMGAQFEEISQRVADFSNNHR